MLIERALAAAVRLVDPAHPELDVLTVGASDQGIARLRGLIDDLLGPRRINIRVRNVELANVAHLALQAAALGNDLVIVESDMPLLSGEGTEQLLEQSDCQILVVR